MDRIADLLQVHDEIAELLEYACLHLEGPALEHLDTLLRWHLRGENELLIPRYAALEPDPPRVGKPSLLLEEHEKILRHLSEARSSSGLERLKTLRRLAHLLEHHDERETQSFKLALDNLLDTDERRRLLDEITATRPTLPALPRRPPSPELPGLVGAEVERLRSSVDRFEARAKSVGERAATGYARKMEHLVAQMLRHWSAGEMLATMDSSLSLANLLASVGRAIQAKREQQEG